MKNNIPTQRTLKLLRETGYPAQVVERWNPFARRRVDLFNFIDVVAITNTGILGVQVTTRKGRSAHKKKIKEAEFFQPWLDAGGRIELWSWRKEKNRWKVDVDVFE